MMAVMRSVEVKPEGNLLDTATFNAAVGVFLLTLSVLAPGVSWSAKGRRRWVLLLSVFTLYGYGVETVQAFRGLDPRFSRVAGPIDQIAGLIFLLIALGIMVCVGILAIKYFRAEASLLNLAVRYGAFASGIGFAVGLWMSLVTQGRLVPESGNLLFVHAVGFHGLQAIPIVGWFLQGSKVSQAAARTQVHLAGLTWTAACIALALQAVSGRATIEIAPATLTAVLCLAVFLLTAFRAVGTWLRSATITG
jgi:hypothetical protein